MSFYEIDILNTDGSLKSLSDYKGKVLLVVNTATECVFTNQYAELESLYKKYHEKGFEILDFPSDQFGNQAPGTADEIKDFCVGKFGVTFPQFKKIDVNGDNQSELFKYLKSKKGGTINSDIKWNFTKFLISKNGEVIKRYSPMTNPKDIEDDIKKEL